MTVVTWSWFLPYRCMVINAYECRKDKMKIMAEKILIITGGTVDYEWAKDWLSAKTYDYCIAADSGLVHADKLGIRVDYILGDYDSVNERLLDTYKKDTQTVTVLLSGCTDRFLPIR